MQCLIDRESIDHPKESALNGIQHNNQHTSIAQSKSSNNNLQCSQVGHSNKSVRIDVVNGVLAEMPSQRRKKEMEKNN